MNKYDKYYLKQGKLELSMLDDEDDDYEVSRQPRSKSKQIEERLKGLNLEHTKRIREHGVTRKLSVSKEVYSTLHTMGQYLTKNEQAASSISGLPARKPMNSAKAQLLEELASSVKVKEMELPPAPVKKEAASNLCITQADEIKSVSEQIGLAGQNEPQSDTYDHIAESQEAQAVDTPSDNNTILEIEYEVAACYDQDIVIEKEEDIPEFKSKDTKQDEIDLLLQRLIKPKIIEDSTAEILRAHVNRHIAMIRNNNKF